MPPRRTKAGVTPRPLGASRLERANRRSHPPEGQVDLASCGGPTAAVAAVIPEGRVDLAS